MPMQSYARLPRNTLIALGVVLFHAGALWALQTGLLRRVAEEIIPAEILSEWVEPAAAKPEAKPSAPPPINHLPRARQEPVKALTEPVAAKEVASLADSTSANAPTVPAISDASTPAPATPATPSNQQNIAAAAQPPTARLELPSSDAQYLQNPKPSYPGMSKRLGEQGRVVVRVLIGVNGTAQKVEIQQSSGFDRLDQAALSTISSWRFVPGKRGGVPEAMWFNVPINFVLE